MTSSTIDSIVSVVDGEVLASRWKRRRIDDDEEGNLDNTTKIDTAAASLSSVGIAAVGVNGTEAKRRKLESTSDVDETMALTSSAVERPHVGVPHQKDTTFTKIFVGGLPYHTTDVMLRSFFEPFGDILEAVVITDRQTGKSRGYGFVSIYTPVHT